MNDIEFDSDRNVFLVTKNRLHEFGKDIAEILVEIKFCNTKSEGRRLIEQKAVKIGNILIQHKFARLCGDKQHAFIVEPKSS